MPNRLLTPLSASPLTEPPKTPPPELELTPKAVTEEVAKKKKEKKQIIDSITELEDGPGARVGRSRNGGLDDYFALFGCRMTVSVWDV